MKENKVHLTSGEMAVLWTGYLNDSMSLPLLDYFVKTVEDNEIKPVIEFARQLSDGHIKFLTDFFQNEKFPIPRGFSANDVNLNAQKLYTDTFMLEFIMQMAKSGLVAYGSSLGMCARKDLRAYFIKCIDQTVELFEKATDIALEKGIYLRRPFIDIPAETDMIDDKSYLSGLNPLKKPRPLNAIEIAHLSFNVETNMVGTMLALSFSQAAKSKEIISYMERGRDISKKHVKVLSATLLDNDIQAPNSADYAVKGNDESPFSERLMMQLMAFLSTLGSGNYSAAASASQRSDLILNYERLSLEIAQFAKDGADIMIKHKWLEQPPGSPNRTDLARRQS